MKHLIEMSKFLVQPFSIPYKRGTVMSAIYYYGQDGETVDDDLIKMFGLSTKEIRYSDKLDANVFNIVGFVYKDNKILVVFPKHYYEKSDIDAFNKTNVNLGSDIKLLYNVIKNIEKLLQHQPNRILGHSMDILQISLSKRFMKYMTITKNMAYIKKKKQKL